MLNKITRLLTAFALAYSTIAPAYAAGPTGASSVASTFGAPTVNNDGSMSIPAGTAPAGSPVVFYVEGTSVGTATAASDGSATLLKPLYPPANQAKVAYGALKTSTSAVAPAPTIPAYTTYNNILTTSNDQSTWTALRSTYTKLDTLNGQIATAGGAGTAGPPDTRSTYINIGVPLATGTYTFGFTAVRTAGTGTLQPRAFFPKYAQPAANPTITDNTPYRTSVTFTVDAGNSGSSQSVAISGNNIDQSTSDSTFKFYNVVLASGSIDPFTAADAPRTNPVQAPSVDYTAQYATTPNFPTDPVFTKADAKPKYGSLQPGAVNVMHYDFTKNTGNVRDRLTLNKHFFLSSVNPGYPPNIRLAVSPNNAYDGVDGAIGYGRMRTYPDGHPYNLHKFTDAGIYLDVIGNQNDKQTYLYPPNSGGGNATVYAGYMRSQTIYRPCMTVEVDAQFPSDIEGWGPTWLLGFTQISPGRVPASNGDPMFGYQANPDGTVPGGFTPGPVQTDNGNQYQLFYPLSHKGKTIYGEFDWPDMWNDTSNNPAYKGRTMSAGIVNGAVSVDEVNAPYHSFIANSNGYTYVSPNRYAFKTGGTAADAAIHTATFNWRCDGSNMVDFLFDGVVYLQGYKEFYAGQFYNILTKRMEQLGMMDMIGGQYGRGFANKNPITPDGGTKGLLVARLDAWIGNLDLSTVTIPTNGLTNYPAVTLDNTSAIINNAYSGTIGNARSSGTRLRATSSDGTVLSLSGSGASQTLSGTFTTPGAKTISVVEIPYVAGQVAQGVPTTTTFTINVAASATLNNLALTPTSTNIGNAYAGTLSPTTSGSTVTAASDDSTAVTVTGTGTTRTASATFTTSGVKNITPTETLSGTTKTSPATALTVNADNPTGANLVTDQTIGGSTWTIGTISSSPSLTVTAGQSDVSGGTTGQLVVPTTASGLHRFSKTFTALTSSGLYETYVIVKRSGTGAGSRYILIGNSNNWGKAVCDFQPSFPVCKVDTTYTPSGGYFVTPLANGFYKMGVRGNIPATTSQSMFIELVNGYNTDDTATGVGTYSGDGTSGFIFSGTYFGTP